MSSIKDRLKMFENTDPPAVKPKPRSPINVVKANPIKNEMDNVAVQTPPSNPDNLVNHKPCENIDDFVSNGLNSTKDLKPIDPKDDSGIDDSDEDLTYELGGSLYHLPGLENFLSAEVDEETPDSEIIINEPDLSADTTETDKGVTTSDQIVQEVKINLERSGSRKLIEEIFNTSVWRHSINYKDNFIFSPKQESMDEISQDEKIIDFNASMGSNVCNDDRAVSTQSLATKSGRRSIFGGIFRSKRGTKNKEKTPLTSKDIPSDQNHDPEVAQVRHRNKQNDVDTDSIDKPTKKPLNSIFNRDWLNSLGEGIKKKANVMAELRKVFTSKGKAPKRKSHRDETNATCADAEVKKNITIFDDHDDIYDDGGDGDCDSTIEENSKKLDQIPFKIDEVYDKDKDTEVVAPVKKTRSSDCDSIYDDGGDGDPDIDDTNDTPNIQIPVQNTPVTVNNLEPIDIRDPTPNVPRPIIISPTSPPSHAYIDMNNCDSIYDDGEEDDAPVKIEKPPRKQVAPNENLKSTKWSFQINKTNKTTKEKDTKKAPPSNVESTYAPFKPKEKNKIETIETIEKKSSKSKNKTQEKESKKIKALPVCEEYDMDDTIVETYDDEVEADDVGLKSKDAQKNDDQDIYDDDEADEHKFGKNTCNKRDSEKVDKSKEIEKSQTKPLKTPQKTKDKKDSKFIKGKNKGNKCWTAKFLDDKKTKELVIEEYDNDEDGEKVSDIKDINKARTENKNKDKHADNVMKNVSDGFVKVQNKPSKEWTIMAVLRGKSSNMKNPKKEKKVKKKDVIDTYIYDEDESSSNYPGESEKANISEAINGVENKTSCATFNPDNDDIYDDGGDGDCDSTIEENSKKLDQIPFKIDEVYDEDNDTEVVAPVKKTRSSDCDSIYDDGGDGDPDIDDTNDTPNIQIPVQNAPVTVNNLEPIDIRDPTPNVPRPIIISPTSPPSHAYIDMNNCDSIYDDGEEDDAPVKIEKPPRKQVAPNENLKSTKWSFQKNKTNKTTKEKDTKKAPPSNVESTYAPFKPKEKNKIETIEKKSSKPKNKVQEKESKKIKALPVCEEYDKDDTIVEIYEDEVEADDIGLKSKDAQKNDDQDIYDDDEADEKVPEKKNQNKTETEKNKPTQEIKPPPAKISKAPKTVNKKPSIPNQKISTKKTAVVEEYDEDVNSEEHKPDPQCIQKTNEKVPTKPSKVNLSSKISSEWNRRRNNIIVNLRGQTSNKKTAKMIPMKVNKKVVVDTYTYDDENTIDPVMEKLIKKNLASAKKVFKLKDPIVALSEAKVTKTVIPQHKNHLQVNIGELVQIIQYNNELALIKNSLGKCGWISTSNLKVIN